MTVVLYDSAVSGNCYKVRLLFALLGVEVRAPSSFCIINKWDREEVLGDLNPGLRVPTRGPRGRGGLSGESGAILWYFRGRDADTSPSDPFGRAKALQWMFFEQYSHEPYIAVSRTWLMHDLTPSPAALAELQRRRLRRAGRVEQGLAEGRAFLANEATRSPTSRCTPTRTSRPGRHRPLRLPAAPGLDRPRRPQPGYIPIDD